MRKILALLATTLLTLGLNLAQADGNPSIKMQTSKGDVVIELYPEKAPATVENFLRYVHDEAYDNTTFHRVIKDFMNQGGAFTVEGGKKAIKTYAPIKNEADNGLKNLRGTVAMARTSDPHSATNQFFINTKDNSFLDHTAKTGRGWGYTVFGRVTSGMDVMDRIADVPTGRKGQFPKDAPLTPIEIYSIRVIATDSSEASTGGQP
jgi:cyclophilin family peptidyl-prolyl cis-trans isomerase